MLSILSIILLQIISVPSQKASQSKNYCRSYFYDCCNPKSRNNRLKGVCDDFDCQYYRDHYYEYSNKNVVTWNENVKYWLFHKNDKQGTVHRHVCLSPDHLTAKFKQDSPSNVEEIFVVFESTFVKSSSHPYYQGVIIDGTKHTDVEDKSMQLDVDRTDSTALLWRHLNITEFSEYVESSKVFCSMKKNTHMEDFPNKNKMLIFVHSHCPYNDDPYGEKTTYIEVPLESYPNYRWMLEGDESRPPWRALRGHKEPGAWCRGSRFLLGILDPFIVLDEEKRIRLHNYDYSFCYYLTVPDKKALRMFLYGIERQMLFVFDVHFEVHSSLWKPVRMDLSVAATHIIKGELTITATKTVTLHVDRWFSKRDTFYTNGPTEISISSKQYPNATIEVERFGIELNDDGVHYFFSQKYQGEDDDVAVIATYPVNVSETVNETIPVTYPEAVSKIIQPPVSRDCKVACDLAVLFILLLRVFLLI